MILEYKITEDMITIKEFLKKTTVSRNLTSGKNKDNVFFYVNNQEVYNYFQMHKGDSLVIVISERNKETSVNPIKEPIKIIYEDSYLLIVEKRAGLATIPTTNHYDNSLANHIMAYYREKGIVSQIHFINRLDLPTSGIVMLAKNGYIQALMEDVKITKKYLLKTVGHILPSEGKITLPIAKEETSKIKREVTSLGQEAITEYRVLMYENQESLIEATLLTGRTHQLRVHFAHLGYPLVGDKLYGNSVSEKLYLHSSNLEFIHPITKQRLSFRTYPDWWQSHYPQA